MSVRVVTPTIGQSRHVRRGNMAKVRAEARRARAADALADGVLTDTATTDAPDHETDL